MAYTDDRYHILTDSLPQLIWTADNSGNITTANMYCVEYTGLETPERFAREYASMIHPDDVSLINSGWINSIDTGRPFTEEYRLRGANGTYRWFLGKSIPIKNTTGKIDYWIGLATDIDIQKQAIENLENEKKLREQFVTTLTHDLRNPLSAAKTAAQMIGKYSEFPERLMSLSGRLINNLNRTGQMIDHLLDASRIKAGYALELNLANVELYKLVSDTLNELMSIHGDRFILKSSDLVINGYWSEDGIRRVVENLCSNAIKYGSKNDKIIVQLKKGEGEIFISVHNYGNTFSKEETANLFNPFQRKNSKENCESKGWGLGLTIVKGVAEALGGDITVMSSPADGTTFTFKIPNNQKVS